MFSSTRDQRTTFFTFFPFFLLPFGLASGTCFHLFVSENFAVLSLRFVPIKQKLMQFSLGSLSRFHLPVTWPRFFFHFLIHLHSATRLFRSAISLSLFSLRRSRSFRSPGRISRCSGCANNCRERQPLALYSFCLVWDRER